MKKILIIDDDPATALLPQMLSDGDTTAVLCSSMEEAENALFRHLFDAVIADIRLSGTWGVEGLELIGFIKELSPETEVFIMTAQGSKEIEDEAYRKGASGFYEKSGTFHQLVSRIRQSDSAGAVPPCYPDSPRNVLAEQTDSCPLLSPRELEVLKWLKLGKTSWDISRILGISERTVNYHVANIRNKLDVKNRSQAVSEAVSQRLLDSE